VCKLSNNPWKNENENDGKKSKMLLNTPIQYKVVVAIIIIVDWPIEESG